MDHRIQQVFQTIMEGNEPATAALCRELIAQGIPASRIVRQGMIPCMDQLGGIRPLNGAAYAAYGAGSQRIDSDDRAGMNGLNNRANHFHRFDLSARNI